MALWRKHALSGTDRPGRHTDHSGLRHRTTHAGEPVGGAEKRERSRDAHSGHALSLGPHSGDTVFFPPVCGEQRISFLQFSFEISGTRQLETGFRSADGVALFPGGHVGDERQAEVQRNGGRRFLYGWATPDYGALAESHARSPGLSNLD